MPRSGRKPYRQSAQGASSRRLCGSGSPLLVLDGSSPEPWFDYPVGSQATRLVSAALRDGHVVIVPERPVMLEGAERLGWWIRGCRTAGAAWDVLDTGGGETGYGPLIWNSFRNMPIYQRLGACVVIGFIIANVTTYAQEGVQSASTKALISGAGGAANSAVSFACGVG